MSLLTTPTGGKGAVSSALAIAPRTAALLAHFDQTSSTGSYTATKGCTVILRGYGGGASGGERSAAPGAAGAGGGAAGYKVYRLGAGQIISWSVGAGGAAIATDPAAGNPGADTTITLPGGYVLKAGGGGAGGLATGGAGGVASGPWDIGRNGAAGGDGGASSTAGGSPTGGGTGGASSGNYGGGGGAAGFSDLFPGVTSGNGVAGNNAAAAGSPGGGTGGIAAAGGSGGAGRVIVTVLDLG